MREHTTHMMCQGKWAEISLQSIDHRTFECCICYPHEGCALNTKVADPIEPERCKHGNKTCLTCYIEMMNKTQPAEPDKAIGTCERCGREFSSVSAVHTCKPNTDNKFSKFFSKDTSPEEQRQVIGKAIHDSNEEQKGIIVEAYSLEERLLGACDDYRLGCVYSEAQVINRTEMSKIQECVHAYVSTDLVEDSVAKRFAADLLRAVQTDTIKDFVKGTDTWATKFPYKDEQCMLCGIIPANMVKLMNDLKEIDAEIEGLEK